jgi:serine/threonine protein kinase
MKDRTWKVADFGLTCEATSTALLFTDFSRGTPGYRAPELLKEMHVGYNNKIDIWAMGCILFEIATGQKPFANDTMVTEYSRGGSPLEIRCNLITGQDGEEFISSSIRDMLQTEPSFRPASADLCTRFDQYHQLTDKEQRTTAVDTESHEARGSQEIDAYDQSPPPSPKGTVD